MVTGDTDAVELRHVLAGITEYIRNNPHARSGRIDVGIADHELLENVVLDGSSELVLLHALFLSRDDVQGHDREHGTVHGHRDADVA
jgi:hypothetical protein